MQHASSPADDLIGISEAARRVGVDKSVLSRQVRDGKIRSHGGKVRLSEVLEDRAANIDLTRTGKAAGDQAPVVVDGSPMPYHVAKAMKESYLALLRQQEFEVKAGTLVDRAAAEKAFFEEARTLRDGLLAWPSRIAIEAAEEIQIDRSTGKVDARSLTVVLDRYMKQHLTEMGDPDTDLPKL